MTRLRFALAAFVAGWKAYPAFEKARRELFGAIAIPCDCPVCQKSRALGLPGFERSVPPEARPK